MIVAVLSPYPHWITGALDAAGDEWTVYERIEDVPSADFVVSYGHRRIIKEPHLNHWARRLINLHISYLPWNRGADPNLWSWVDDTPKGVTIHQIDRGIDTGPILAQREVPLSGTLATSKEQLRGAMADLFAEKWRLIRGRGIDPPPQDRKAGSYHTIAESAVMLASLPLGHDTPVEFILDRSIRR